MAVNDIVQANIVGSIFNQTTINALWYYAQSGPGAVSQLLNKLFSDVIPILKNLVTTEFTVVRIDGMKVFPLPRAFAISHVVNQPGSQVAPTVSINVAMTVTKQTAFAGRKYRGRWFFCGHPTIAMASGVFSPSNVTAWQALANELAINLTDGDGTVWNPILVHGRIPTTGSASYTPITACRANGTPRNMRRRQIGIGI